MGIKIGSFVEWTEGVGRVDLVVRNGTTPGVKSAPVGTPVARVVVYRDGARTAERVAVPLDSLRLTPAIDAAAGKSGFDAVLAMHAAHEQYVDDAGLPPAQALSALAVKTAYERGLVDYPGEETGLSAEEWGVGRAAHLMKAALAPNAIDSNDADLLSTREPRSLPIVPEVIPLGIAEGSGSDEEFDAEEQAGDADPEATTEAAVEPATDAAVVEDDEVVVVDAADVASTIAAIEQEVADGES